MELRLKLSRIPRNNAAWLATLWALLFAIPSFYWALGGTLGVSTIAADSDPALGAAGEPWVVALTGVLKLLLALFAASFDFPRILPGLRTARVILGWLAAGFLLLYGVVSSADHLAMVTGIRSTPAALGDDAVR